MTPVLEAQRASALQQNTRSAPLDGLRGIAILSVLIIHLEGYAGPWAHLLPRSFLVVSRNLWIGVDLFFVLSGFLITGILLDSRTEPARKAITSFYARRILRIVPLYYCVCLVVFVVLPAISGTLRTSWHGPEYLSYVLFVSNLLQSWRGVALGGLLTVAWSLAIEEQFYLVWPWIVRRISIRNLQRTCAAIILVSPLIRFAAWKLGANLETLYVLTALRLDGLAAGAWLAVELRHGAPSLRRAWQVLAITSAVYVILVASALSFPAAGTSFNSMAYFHSQPILFTAGYAVIAVAFACLVLIAIRSTGRLATLLSNQVLMECGRLSFSIYLLHIMIGVRLQYLVSGQLHFFRLGDGWASFGLYALLFSALLYGSARVSWALIESPALSLKRHFPY